MPHHRSHFFLPRPPENDPNQLVASLDNAYAFGHEVEYVRVVETHISWVILTGRFAYKIKKPVDFGFLDFRLWKNDVAIAKKN